MEDDAYRIPPDFGNAGDPVDGNPFPHGSAAHATWAEATKVAEDEFLRLQLEISDPAHLARFASHELGSIDWIVIPSVRKFDIWAKRGVHVVWSDGELANYEKWLVAYANSWIGGLIRFFEKHPAPFNVEPLFVEARNLLSQRVLFWRVQARRYRAEQTEAQKSESPTRVIQPKLKAKRRGLIAEFKDRYGLTAEGFSRKVGVSTTGIRAIVSETRNRFSDASQARLLRTLQVSKREWYSL
jgi:hypothetical protein